MNHTWRYQLIFLQFVVSHILTLSHISQLAFCLMKNFKISSYCIQYTQNINLIRGKFEFVINYLFLRTSRYLPDRDKSLSCFISIMTDSKNLTHDKRVRGGTRGVGSKGHLSVKSKKHINIENSRKNGCEIL